MWRAWQPPLFAETGIDNKIIVSPSLYPRILPCDAPSLLLHLLQFVPYVKPIGKNFLVFAFPLRHVTYFAIRPVSCTSRFLTYRAGARRLLRGQIPTFLL